MVTNVTTAKTGWSIGFCLDQMIWWSDILKEWQKEDKKRCELRKEKLRQEHTKLLADKKH